MRRKPDINVWRRIANEDRDEDDPRAYQADIYIDGRDYHGIAANPAEALLLAAEFWRDQEYPCASD